MTNLKTTNLNTAIKTENPDDPNVRDPKHKHELGGTVGMTVLGVVGGIGAGVAAGAAAGSMAGPIGVVAGAAIGGAIGGVAGEKIAREINPTAEEEYWEENYHTRPYVVQEYDFEVYRPAYRSGIDAYRNNPRQSFDQVEPTLRDNWNTGTGESNLDWSDARHAAKDAHDRLSNFK